MRRGCGASSGLVPVESDRHRPHPFDPALYLGSRGVSIAQKPGPCATARVPAFAVLRAVCTDLRTDPRGRSPPATEDKVLRRATGGGHGADDKATPPRERGTEPTAGGSREATGATRCHGASEERVEPHRSEPHRRPARSMRSPSGTDIPPAVLSLSEKGRPMGEGEMEVQTGDACIVCWQTPTDRAHLIDRSLARDPDSDPLRTVRLCRTHHDAYDAHELDLLPYLEPCHRKELARAVELVGLVGALERITGMAWRAHPLAARGLWHGESKVAVLQHQGVDHADLFGGRVDA